MVRALGLLLLAAASVVQGLSRPVVEKRDTSTPQSTTTDLPLFLADGSSSGAAPWGTSTPSNNYVPNTGKTRKYNFVVSRKPASPDGVTKSSILINGQTVGPLIEANWGDWISVTVTNGITTPEVEGFTLHWHGFLQRQTPWYDGVPGVSQCPIAPGKTFTYTFQADQFGTSWYHSHYSAQYTDGAFGPIVIYGPKQHGAHHDHDLGTFVFNDYFHPSYETNRNDSLKKPPVFLPIDNNLVNGVGCNESGGTCNWAATKLQRYKFKTGQKYLMRFINAGGAATQKISIDNHQMTIVANDFTPINPVNTSVVTLGVGQRTDVIVQAIGKATDAVYLRGVLDAACANDTVINGEARAIIQYQDAAANVLPSSKATPVSSNGCQGDPIASSVPAYPSAPPAVPGTTRNVNISFVVNGTGNAVFVVDGNTFHSDYNVPTLALAAAGNDTYPTQPDWNVYNFGTNSSVRMVLYNYATFVHPMHLHGHNFWVLAQGFGKWNGTITNPTNPARRDTVLMPPGFTNNPSYLVMEWNQDNPGIWPLHCHISIHVSYGLLLNVMERPDLIATDRQIPGVIGQTCKDWSAYTSHHIVDEPDSGV